MKPAVFFVFVGIVIVCVTLGGCMVGPKYSRPETAASIAERFFYADANNSDVNDANQIGRWWENFADDVTTRLVTEALNNNYDLRIAAAKVLQARAEYVESGGKLLPEVTADFDRKMVRQDSGPPGSATEKTGKVKKTRTYTGQFTVSYVIDMFGRLRHGRAAELNDMLAAKANENAVINSMIATVIKTRVNIATLQRRIAIAQANIASRRNTLEIIERRYSNGLVSPLDVRLGRENLASVQVILPTLQNQLTDQSRNLDLLLARRPGFSQPLSETLTDLPELKTVPAVIPAALLDRRPDVKEAEMALKAQNSRIGVSIAKLYPDLSFTFGLGWSSNRYNDIFVDQAFLYSTLLSISQPIFQGGQLRAQVKAAEAKYEQLAAEYAKTVLTAMKEVEDELASERFQAIQLKYVRVRLKEAVAAEALAKDRYQRGVENLLSVLETERRRIAAEDDLAILKGQIWTARINLFLALGGDWIVKK